MQVLTCTVVQEDGMRTINGDDDEEMGTRQSGRRTDASVKRQDVSKHTFGMEDEDTSAATQISSRYRIL